MALTRARLSEAELVLFIIDGSRQLDERDQAIINELSNRQVITVLNKEDLAPAVNTDQVQKLLPCTAVSISARCGSGIDQLQELIYQTVLSFPHSSAADSIITNARQQDALMRTTAAVTSAQQAVHEGIAPELIAIDLHAALQALGEITGETTADDILERIFASFCIGK
jgi:tRNA modification GTPase